jgi:hypothetical protein
LQIDCFREKRVVQARNLFVFLSNRPDSVLTRDILDALQPSNHYVKTIGFLYPPIQKDTLSQEETPMSTTVVTPTIASRGDTVLGDWATLSCDAAIELDNLLQGQPQTLGSVRKLGERMAKEIPNASNLSSLKHLVDPSTFVVMGRVIRESAFAGAPNQANQVTELTQAAGKIAKYLVGISDDPAEALTNPPILEKLRDFCLLLSKRSAARGVNVEMKPSHPYRKQG